MDLVELKKSGEEVARHPWELARAVIAIEKIKQLTIAPSTTILDVGCGDTYFIKQLASVFPQNKIVGVDIAFTPELIKQLSIDLPSNVSIVSGLNELNFDEHQVSLVLLMDVIEHVPDDVALLNEILTALKVQKNRVHFVITVPAFQALFSAHDVFLEHYRRYTYGGLTSVLRRTGFSISNGGYFFTSLLFARIAVKLLETLKLINQDAKGIAAFKGGAFKVGLIKWILLVDYRFGQFFNLFGIKIPGLSCYAICSRQL